MSDFSYSPRRQPPPVSRATRDRHGKWIMWNFRVNRLREEAFAAFLAGTPGPEAFAELGRRLAEIDEQNPEPDQWGPPARPRTR